MVRFSCDAEQFGALAFFGTDRFKPGWPIFNDGGNIGQRFDVVYNGRMPEQSLFSRVGRFCMRHSTAAFNACNQGRLLPANKCACPLMDRDVQGKPATENIFADEPVFPGLFDGILQNDKGLGVVGPNVNIGVV